MPGKSKHGPPDPNQTVGAAPTALPRLRTNVPTHLIEAVAVGGLALLLALPGFRFPYLFDDFDFLERVLHFSPTVLLPDPRELFYRPLSREAFFGLLHLFGRHGPLIGHLANATAVAAAAVLLYRVSTRLLGPLAGVVTGISFAAFAGNPLLVAWVSGCQDSLAIVFIAAALLLELDGRHVLAVAAAGLALLAKETVAMLIPAIALSRWLLGMGVARDRRRIADYAVLLLVWVAMHPGIHNLVRRGFIGPELSYVGIDNPSRWHSLLKSLITLANIPFEPRSTEWYRPLTLIAAPALTLAAFVGWRASLGRAGKVAPVGPGPARVILLGLLLAAPPLLLTSLIVKHWAPYYVCIPAIGASLMLGAMSSILPRRSIPVLLALYTAGGLWSRCSTIDPGLPTERSLAPAASALGRIESQMRVLVPEVRPNTQALVFILAQGTASVHLHFYHFQILRTWYQDPSLTTIRPELREPDGRPEILLWISPSDNVFRIDLGTLKAYSLAAQPSYFEYQKVMRAYARGLANSGNPQNALRILLEMPEPNAAYRGLDYRIAAALLLQNGRQEEARRLLSVVPPLTREESLDLVAGLLTAPARPPIDDASWFEAFELSPSDAASVRFVMEKMNAQKQPAAERMAARLLLLRPNDLRAKAILDSARAYPDPFAVTPRGL